MSSETETQCGHILYVDDDEAMVYLVQRRLRKHGWQVTAFCNPVEALETFAADPNSYNVAISDYNMPKTSGLELLAAIRKVRPDVPTILTSGYLSEDVVKRASELGITRVVGKTENIDDLVDSICGLLGSGV